MQDRKRAGSWTQLTSAHMTVNPFDPAAATLASINHLHHLSYAEWLPLPTSKGCSTQQHLHFRNLPVTNLTFNWSTMEHVFWLKYKILLWRFRFLLTLFLSHIVSINCDCCGKTWMNCHSTRTLPSTEITVYHNDGYNDIDTSQ